MFKKQIVLIVLVTLFWVFLALRRLPHANQDEFMVTPLPGIYVCVDEHG
jgi:hypothetical protein